MKESLRLKYPEEYKSFANMKRNCYPGYTTETTYEKYGIEVCSEWLEEGFKRFLEDMGTKPSPEHKLLRKDPKKDFCADNCHWSTETPKRIDNIIITVDKQTMNLYNWCKKYDWDYSWLHRQIKKKRLDPVELVKERLNKLK